MTDDYPVEGAERMDRPYEPPGAPRGEPPAGPPRSSGLATASLVLGILSPVCCWIFAGVPALILGILGLREVDRSRGTVVGRGRALAGIILGGGGILVWPVLVATIVFLNPRFVCNVEIQVLGAMAEQYAARHDGRLPAKLEDLDEGGQNVVDNLRCLVDRGPGPSYELLQPGKKLADLPRNTVIIREVRPNHGNRRHVLHADMTVELLPPGQ